MRPLTEIEKLAQKAIIRLRAESLQNGNTFMTYDPDLPTGQYYMEYPDGTMKIVTASRKDMDFIVEKELTQAQADLIRDRLHAQYI